MSGTGNNCSLSSTDGPQVGCESQPVSVTEGGAGTINSVVLAKFAWGRSAMVVPDFVPRIKNCIIPPLITHSKAASLLILACSGP